MGSFITVDAVARFVNAEEAFKDASLLLKGNADTAIAFAGSQSKIILQSSATLMIAGRSADEANGTVFISAALS